MSWATYEDMCAEIPVIVPDDALCIRCETNEPEPGCDHCQPCLDVLNDIAWDRLYGTGSPVSERQRHQDEAQPVGGAR